MDSTPLLKLAEISHKAASVSRLIFPLLIILPQGHPAGAPSATPKELNTNWQFSKLYPSYWLLLALPWPTSS